MAKFKPSNIDPATARANVIAALNTKTLTKKDRVLEFIKQDLNTYRSAYKSGKSGTEIAEILTKEKLFGEVSRQLVIEVLKELLVIEPNSDAKPTVAVLTAAVKPTVAVPSDVVKPTAVVPPSPAASTTPPPSVTQQQAHFRPKI